MKELDQRLVVNSKYHTDGLAIMSGQDIQFNIDGKTVAAVRANDKFLYSAECSIVNWQAQLSAVAVIAAARWQVLELETENEFSKRSLTQLFHESDGEILDFREFIAR